MSSMWAVGRLNTQLMGLKTSEPSTLASLRTRDEDWFQYIRRKDILYVVSSRYKLSHNYTRESAPALPRDQADQQLSYFSVIICRTAPVSRL